MAVTLGGRGPLMARGLRLRLSDSLVSPPTPSPRPAEPCPVFCSRKATVSRSREPYSQAGRTPGQERRAQCLRVLTDAGEPGPAGTVRREGAGGEV